MGRGPVQPSHSASFIPQPPLAEREAQRPGHGGGDAEPGAGGACAGAGGEQESMLSPPPATGPALGPCPATGAFCRHARHRQRKRSSAPLEPVDPGAKRSQTSPPAAVSCAAVIPCWYSCGARAITSNGTSPWDTANALQMLGKPRSCAKY